MTRTLPSKLTSAMNRRLIRFSGWRAGANRRGIPVGLLTTTGRRTGKERTTPLMYLDEGNRYLVVASNSGFDAQPAWFLNLVASPQATFERGGQCEPVRACVLDAAEASMLWPRLEAHNPLWGAYARLTARDMPVIALEPAPR
jgi:deazaflavin-dependent oxidoreductase (nitroreductase family)